MSEDRIKKLEERVKILEEKMAVAEGCCPECFNPIEGWKVPLGSLAPEAWATLREQGIDPVTGHKSSCSRAKK